MFTVRMKVGEDGSIYLKGPPLKPGQSVEVHVKEVPERKLTEAEMEELRQWGQNPNFHYYLPFESADQENWEELLEKVSPYEREGDWTLLSPEELEELERGPAKENLE